MSGSGLALHAYGSLVSVLVGLEGFLMATLYGLSRNFYAYISDNGTTYQVAVTDNDAAAGGFGSPVAYGSLPVYPRGWKMRKQYGISSGNGRTKTPVADPASAQWTAPSTFLKHGATFAAEGSIGEKRTAKS